MSAPGAPDGPAPAPADAAGEPLAAADSDATGLASAVADAAAGVAAAGDATCGDGDAAPAHAPTESATNAQTEATVEARVMPSIPLDTVEDPILSVMLPARRRTAGRRGQPVPAFARQTTAAVRRLASANEPLYDDMVTERAVPGPSNTTKQLAATVVAGVIGLLLVATSPAVACSVAGDMAIKDLGPDQIVLVGTIGDRVAGGRVFNVERVYNGPPTAQIFIAFREGQYDDCTYEATEGTRLVIAPDRGDNGRLRADLGTIKADPASDDGRRYIAEATALFGPGIAPGTVVIEEAPASEQTQVPMLGEDVRLPLIVVAAVVVLLFAVVVVLARRQDARA